MVSDTDGVNARLKEALKASGLSNAELANAIGVTVQAVSKWLNKGGISQQRLPAVARVLGVSLEWLLMGVDRPPASQDLTQVQQLYTAASAEVRQLIDTVLQRAHQGDLSNGLAGAVRQLLNELPTQEKQKS
jgi:transcriptional regulator with XRE-family HTH domain